jgi:TRAP-type uncharacterized transport system substrate-binding protein
MNTKKVLFSTLFLLLANSTALQSVAGDGKVPFVICGGAEGGRYITVASDIGQFVGDVVAPKVEVTKGSMENLARISAGTCDAGISQRDAIAVQQARDPNFKLSIETAATLYAETIHFLCPKNSGVTKLSTIREKPEGIVLFVGSQNGGSHITWENIAKNIKALEKVPTVFIGGQRAITAVTEGRYEHGGQIVVPCMIWVGGVGAQLMKDADDVRITLIDLDLGEIGDIKDRFGKPAYTKIGINTSEYAYLDDLHMFGSVVSYTTDAVFLVLTSWADEHEVQYNQLLKKLRQFVTSPPKK